jgi:4-hydroxy-tetrahydrodipicolinate synthase
VTQLAKDLDVSKFGGVSILTVTPLDCEGRLCEQDFTSLLRFVSAPSVEEESISSVTVCAEMGEGFCLAIEDRDRAISLAKQCIGKDKAVISAIFALSLRDAIEQAERSKKNGADALLVAPVATFPYSTTALCKFFDLLGKAVQLPIIAYLNKMFKSPLPPAEMVRAVYELPYVIGIKDSTGDFAYITQLIEQRPPGKLLIHTVSSNALAGVQAGADGLMLGTSNLVPQAVLEAWVYGRRQDPKSQDRAVTAQARLNQMVQLYKLAPDTETKDWVIVKEALWQMGVINEAAKYPALPYEVLSGVDQNKVRELLLQAQVPLPNFKFVEGHRA